MRLLLLFPAPLLLLLGIAAADEILVVTPGEFEPALKAWKSHREKQGMTVTVRPTLDVRGPRGPQFILLLGDVKRVPCAYVPAVAIKEYERDARIATDNGFADLDGDGLPDVAIGRIPADSREEAEAMLGRIVAYEESRDFGTWRRRVNVIAGIAGFGAIFDALIEQASTTLLREGIPASYDLHVTWANPSSPFCPPPSGVGDAAVERFNEGALFVTYMGHGSPRNLDRMRWNDRAYAIFDEDAVDRLNAQHPPIAYLSCCSAGHFDGDLDCLAEFMLKAPGGPVAVIASSRVSMPYSNGVLSKEMLDALFKDRVATVGEMLLLAKRRLVEPKPGPDAMRKGIDIMGTMWRPEPVLAVERREHLSLYNLLGDPSMRLPRPSDVTLACQTSIPAGWTLAVEGKCDVPGDAIVELVRERSPDVPKREGNTDADFAKCYERANAWVKASAKARCEGGAFKATIAVPGDLAPGKYVLRAYVTGADGAALGARDVGVRMARRVENVLFVCDDQGNKLEGWLDRRGRFTPKAGAKPSKLDLGWSGPRVITKDEVKEILEPRASPPDGE